MVTYQEYRLRGGIRGFCDECYEWTLRTYDDEMLSASIVSLSNACEAVRPRLVLFNGQAAISSRDRHLILRFQLVQYAEYPFEANWSIECKARLDPTTSLTSGAWNHSMATADWPRPQLDLERFNQPFELEPCCTAPIIRDLRSLYPLGIGRYEFHGVFVDEHRESVDSYVVFLHVQSNGELRGETSIASSRTEALYGKWDRDTCTWEDSHGLSIEAQVETVLLMGNWTRRASSGWFELSSIASKRQWRWEDHAETPKTLQQALVTCQELVIRGFDKRIWYEIFSFCDYDWFQSSE